ncbi:hypothetical protein CPAR01_16170, partial [Colletotrichum paranaense]
IHTKARTLKNRLGLKHTVLVVNVTRRLKNAKRAEITSNNTQLLPQVDPDNLLDVEGVPATLGDFWSMDGMYHNATFASSPRTLEWSRTRSHTPSSCNKRLSGLPGLLTEIMT